MPDVSPWDDIGVPGTDFNVRQAMGKTAVPCFWGRDKSGACLFIVELQGDHREQYRKSAVTVNGIDVDLRGRDAGLQRLVLAGIAVFLILKLRSVLGTREGFEKPAVPADQVRPRTNRPFEVIEGGPDRDVTDHVAEGSDAARALGAMKQAEPGFSVSEFLTGARGAYEMILMAFERGDLDSIRPFLNDEVEASFAQAINAREREGLTVEANFIGLRELVLFEAEYDPATRTAEITVRFTGELTTVIRNAAGDVKTVRIKTANGYKLTVDGALVIAAWLMNNKQSGGSYTPAMLLGAELVEKLPGSGKFVIG